MALRDGDVVRFDYTLWTEGSDKPLETSIEEVAREHGIVHEKKYRPLTVTLGANQIIKGLESHMRSHGQKGKAVTVEIRPEDAYGARDPKKIRDVPMAQFKANKVAPEVGMVLNLQGARGVVTRVAGGRVRVDTNHDLAGKTLRYEYTIRDVMGDEQAKVEAVLENLFPSGGVKADVDDSAVTVHVPDQAKFDQNWMMAKFRIVAELRAATQKKKSIRFLETFPIMDDEPGHEGHGHGPGGHHGEEE